MSIKASAGICGHRCVLQEPESCSSVAAIVETVHAEKAGSMAVGQLVGRGEGVGNVILSLHRRVGGLLPGPLTEIVDVLAAAAAQNIVSMTGRVGDYAGGSQRVSQARPIVSVRTECNECVSA